MFVVLQMNKDKIRRTLSNKKTFSNYLQNSIIFGILIAISFNNKKLKSIITVYIG